MLAKNIVLSSPVLWSNRHQYDFENSTKIMSKIKSFYAKPFIFIYRSSITLGTFNNLEESFIVLTLVTECDTQFECWMEDDRHHSGEKSLHELDLNIHLYLTLNYVTASEHLKYSARKLYGVL